MLVSEDHIREIAKDLGVLGKFVAVYCRHHHGDAVREPFDMKGMDLARTSLGKRKVCPECAKLLGHAVTKRVICPLEPKPGCRVCTEHCYSDHYREQIRRVMKFSGRHLILRGQLHLLLHFLERPPKKPPEHVDRICRKP